MLNTLLHTQFESHPVCWNLFLWHYKNYLKCVINLSSLSIPYLDQTVWKYTQSKHKCLNRNGSICNKQSDHSRLLLDTFESDLLPLALYEGRGSGTFKPVFLWNSSMWVISALRQSSVCLSLFVSTLCCTLCCVVWRPTSWAVECYLTRDSTMQLLNHS